MGIEFERINNTLGKMAAYLGNHKSICVSVSGGSDSDIIVHIICTHFRQHLSKIHFVFANTGIEYKATLDHIKNLESLYGIHIETVKGMPIPSAVKKYGVPFVSKLFSDYLQRLQAHNFKWEEGSFSELYNKYPRAKVAIRFWTNDWGEKSRYNINWVNHLKEFLIKEKPTCRFSSMCCDVSKKRPLKHYQKSVDCDLYITGERKSEGGARAGGHSTCFEKSVKNGSDHYMPLWFWNDETKKYYKDRENIRYSDCYEVYGLDRTGCVGCPFGKNLWNELDTMKRHEPKLYVFCSSVFKESYKLRRDFELYKKTCKADKTIERQLSLLDGEEYD